MCLTPSYIFRHGLHVAHSFRSHGVFSHAWTALPFFVVPICGKTNSSVGSGSIAEDSAIASGAGTSITASKAETRISKGVCASGSGTGDGGGRGGGGPSPEGSDPSGPSPGGSAFASAAIKMGASASAIEIRRVIYF